MHNCVKPCWNNHHHMLCDAVPLCYPSPQPNLTHKLVYSPKSFTSLTLSCRLYISLPVLQVGHFFKKWKEREREQSTKDAQNCGYFCFQEKKGKISRFFYFPLHCFMKTDKGQICYFPSEKAKGALIFSLPIPEWIIIVRLLWVTMCSVARFTFKWNQMAVHSEMIYSNDHGNKSKVLFHIGPAPTRDHCHLGTLQVQSVSYVFAMSRLLPSHFNEWIHQHAA